MKDPDFRRIALAWRNAGREDSRSFEDQMTAKHAPLLVALFVVIAPMPAQDPARVIGLWRGTSTCTDRVAAPACQDEQVVYEFSAGPKPGTVHWVADKIVNGTRVPMGELDMEYDKAEACWKVEFASPRTKVVWRLAVDGKQLTGTARLLPGNETVRRVDLRRQ
ncbi:MAG TPA: hypothetical protein VN716_02385 [Vicinamibacterales bacterium]|nr:hypothetical protein [Vicinamibacterales bacterium]